MRRVERELIDEYRASTSCRRVRPAVRGARAAVEMAGLPDMVRGYEQIKLDNVARYRAAVRAQLAVLGW